MLAHPTSVMCALGCTSAMGNRSAVASSCAAAMKRGMVYEAVLSNTVMWLCKQPERFLSNMFTRMVSDRRSYINVRRSHRRRRCVHVNDICANDEYVF